MAEMDHKTIEHTKADVAANPNHVENDQLEAMDPNASRPETPTQSKAVPIAKDEEGIASAFGQKGPSSAPQQSKPKQKKIAVLTSGGDSAGMNAAGESVWRGNSM
jgi:6-phosphofructokinase 1